MASSQKMDNLICEYTAASDWFPTLACQKLVLQDSSMPEGTFPDAYRSEYRLVRDVWSQPTIDYFAMQM